MSNYTPDRWVIIKIIHNGEPYYKVFGSWKGGYLDSDSWRMNSGIAKIKNKDSYYEFKGFSGSVYKCHKKGYGTFSYTAGILNHFVEIAKGTIAALSEKEALEYILQEHIRVCEEEAE